MFDSLWFSFTEFLKQPAAMQVMAGVVVLQFLWLCALHISQRRARASMAKELDMLQKKNQILTSSSVGMGEKLVQMEARLEKAVNDQHLAAESEAQASYTQALKLIESGVDHRLVASNCGLSDSEVNLMKMLHKASSKNTEAAANESQKPW